MKSVHATSQWTLQGQDGVESLVLKQKTLPELGDFEVLVRIHAASLNYRDLVIAKVMSVHDILIVELKCSLPYGSIHCLYWRIGDFTFASLHVVLTAPPIPIFEHVTIHMQIKSHPNTHGAKN